MIEIMKPNFRFDNENGSLVQLVREGYKQVNVISSGKGAIRGNHYHKYNEEAFYIIEGALKLDVWNSDGIHEYYNFQKGDMFKIKEMISHRFEYTEDTLLVSLYSHGVELGNTEKDIWEKYD